MDSFQNILAIAIWKEVLFLKTSPIFCRNWTVIQMADIHMPFFSLLLFCYWQKDGHRINHELENIYSQSEPQFFSKIRFSICHYSKCLYSSWCRFTPFCFGSGLYLPIINAIHCKYRQKERKEEGKPHPTIMRFYVGIIFWVRTGCGATHLTGSTQHFLFNRLVFFNISVHCH